MRASFEDAVGYLVRQLVRVTQGMPANSVRKAGTYYPAGTESQEYATVKIINTEARRPYGVLTDAAPGTLTEMVYADCKVTASVQFYRHALPAVDGEGLATPGSGAFARAAGMEMLLHSRAALAVLDSMGLGFVSASEARDLSALERGVTYEDRGSVDLTFTIMNATTFLVQSLNVAKVEIQFQPFEGDMLPQTFEMTT